MQHKKSAIVAVYGHHGKSKLLYILSPKKKENVCWPNKMRIQKYIHTHNTNPQTILNTTAVEP